MSDFAGLYDIRDAVENDKNFIRASFLNGLYYGSSWFNRIPKDIFMANYKRVINHLVNNAVIKVASLPDEPNVIIGYSILSPDFQTIHWIYVRKDWRLHGIAKKLVPQHPAAVSHLTEVGISLLSKVSTAIFNPFVL